MLSTPLTSSVPVVSRAGKSGQTQGLHSRESRRNLFAPISPHASIGLGLAIIMYWFVLVLGASANTSDNGSLSYLIVAVSAYLASLAWPFFFYRGEFGWAHPLAVHSLFTLLNIVFRSTGLYTAGLTEHEALLGWPATELTSLLAYEVALQTLGQICLIMGFIHGPRVSILPLRFGKPKHLAGKLIIFLGIAAAALYLYVQHSGTVEQHILNMARGRARVFESELKGLGQYILLMTFAYPAVLIWLAASSNAERNPLFWAAALFALFVAYMELGRRSSVITPIVLGLIVWSLRARKAPFAFTLAVGFAGFVLFGVLGNVRESNYSGTQLRLDAVQGFNIKEVIERNFVELSQRSGSGSSVYPILALVPEEVGLLYGRSYLENLYRFVPRQIFPEKPPGIDTQVNLAFFGGDWGLPPGVLGEAYWNLHVPGVIIIFFLWGSFKRWNFDFYVANHRYPAAIVIYAINIFLFSPSQSPIRLWIYYLVTALIILWAGGLLRFGSARKGAG